jgi:hypothetical protein
MNNIFENLSWYCNARAHGVAFANLEERVRKCEAEGHRIQETVTISFVPTRHYPVRAKK